jgi:hypothetical protein
MRVCYLEHRVVGRLQVRQALSSSVRRLMEEGMCSYVAQHVLEAFGLSAVPLCAICAAVFGVFLAQVQE